MTSANVYYLRFQNIKTRELLHEQRMHVLCKERYAWDKILSLPLDTTEILTWGYDEEEEYWDSGGHHEGWKDEYSLEEFEADNYEDGGSELPTLREWLCKMKLTNRELREKLLEK